MDTYMVSAKCLNCLQTSNIELEKGVEFKQAGPMSYSFEKNKNGLESPLRCTLCGVNKLKILQDEEEDE